MAKLMNPVVQYKTKNDEPSGILRKLILVKAWDNHPDWHGRNWYVQVLLAVASLSPVVE